MNVSVSTIRRTLRQNNLRVDSPKNPSFQEKWSLHGSTCTENCILMP